MYGNTTPLCSAAATDGTSTEGFMVPPKTVQSGSCYTLEQGTT